MCMWCSWRSKRTVRTLFHGIQERDFAASSLRHEPSAFIDVDDIMLVLLQEGDNSKDNKDVTHVFLIQLLVNE